MRFLFVVFFIFNLCHLQAQSHRIMLDETYEDWANISVLAEDPAGDQGSSNIDFGKLWMSHDAGFLFFRLEVGPEINMQEGNEIKVLFKNNIGGADQIPNATGGISYTFEELSIDPLSTYSMDKLNAAHTRVLSYNVLRDDLFAQDKQVYFSRILQAIQPDLVGFQEIYQNGSSQTAAKIASILPITPGQWYHAKVEPDIIAISRYPILATYDISPGGNGAFVIDMDPMKLLFIVAHPPCCANDEGRQSEMDGIMSFVRDAKNGLGPTNLPPNSPILIVGDMNLVGLNQQVKTLLTGDIVNQGLYGADFQPDWDDTDMEDVKPPTTGTPFSMTWYNENSAFSPGRLDYIVYSGSVVQLENSYTLFTPALSSVELNSHNLQADDVVEASDHLPLVADFTFGSSTSVVPTLEHAFQLTVSPNPLTSFSQISYELTKSSRVQLEIYDAKGQQVRTLLDARMGPGSYFLDMPDMDLAAGVYSCQLLTEYGMATEKLVVLH